MTRFGHKLNYVINTFVKHTPEQSFKCIGSFIEFSMRLISQTRKSFGYSVNNDVMFWTVSHVTI